MADEVPAKRGEAAWKEQRDAIAQRNAAAQRQAQVDKKSKDTALDARLRADNVRERDQLHALNKQIDKQRPR